MKSNVNHPKHYNFGKFEVIDVIEDWQLGFNLGNSIKYLGRCGKKDPSKEIEDLEKAVFYINREIKLREKKLNGEKQGSQRARVSKRGKSSAKKARKKSSKANKSTTKGKR